MQGKIKMNKRGDFFTLEVLHIILAVVCLIFLVYLGASMYSILKNKQEIQQAKALQEDLAPLEKDVLDNNAQREYLIIGPKNWFLTSFVAGVRAECNQNPCFCVCNTNDCKGDYSECREVKAKGIVLLSSGSRTDYIEIDKVPMKINIIKKGDAFEIEKAG